MRAHKAAIYIAVFAVILATGSFAQRPPLREETAGDYFPDSAADAPEMTVSVDRDGRQLISVFFDNQPLDVVVGMFNRMPGVNLIANPDELTGRVSVTLREVPWKASLTAILDMHNLMLDQKDPTSQIYSILPVAPDAPDPLVVRSYPLEYASAEDVAAILKPMLSKEASVMAYPAANTLMIKDTEEGLTQIEQIIVQIDNPGEQVFIEAKFMELNDQAIEDLGINWQVLQGISVGTTGVGLDYLRTEEDNFRDERTRSASIIQEETDRSARQFDAAGNEIILPASTVFQSIPGTDPAEFIETRTDQSIRTVDRENTRDTEDSRLIEDFFTDEESLIRTAVLNVDDFSVLLSALKQRDGISIVSNPKIVVSNGKAAVIHIGETERPFISTVTPGQDGIAPLVTFNPGEPVDFGVKLTVTPTVNNGSNITVEIEPELTRFVRDAVAPNGQTYPIVSTKKISTVFSLENGKTVAIGGLTETEDRNLVSKIPLLGDIPLIGKYLFSHEHMVTGQKETIIFVTVGLARPHEMQRDTGLPEDTELTSRRMLDDQLRREQHRLDMLRAGIAAQSELSRIQEESKADWEAFGEAVAPAIPREVYPSDALAPVPMLP